jgi:putative DNA primase/helicase
MIDLSKSDPRISVNNDAMNKNGYLLNFNNGTFDLEKREFYQHRKEDLITHIIRYDFEIELLDKDISDSKWYKFIDKIFMGHTDTIKFMQKSMGMSMIGASLEEKLFFCYGTGGNGKSVLFNVIQDILNPYTTRINIETLMQKNNNDSNKLLATANIAGKRIVLTDESEGGVLNEATVKSLTGNDRTLIGKFLYQNPFEFKPVHSLWMFGNQIPIIKNDDDGIWRRICLIPFEYKFKEDERKPQAEVMADFKKEYPVIIAWLINGALEYLEDGKLIIPDIVKQQTQDYRDEMDMLKDFIEECIIVTDGKYDQVLRKNVHLIYKYYCEKNDEPILGKTKFYNKLEQKGIKKIRGASRMDWYQGINLNEDWIEQYDRETEGEKIGNGKGVKKKSEDKEEAENDAPF